jgi:hypothetical protein
MRFTSKIADEALSILTFWFGFARLESFLELLNPTGVGAL